MRPCFSLLIPVAVIASLASPCWAETGRSSSSHDADNDDWWSDVSVSMMIHRNGEPNACGSTKPISRDIVERLSAAEDKYEMESLLTDAINGILTDETACGSPDDEAAPKNLHGFCDMGPDRTPILLDHDSLVATQGGSLPCRWHTREGLRISTVDQLKAMVGRARAATSASPTCANPQEGGAEEAIPATDPSCEGGAADAEGGGTKIHLYAVPAGRVFLFAPAHVGEIFQLDHLSLLPDASKPIFMKVLSISPKVFDILNFFTKDEADEVVRRALAETSPTHKIKRSTTGTSEKSVFDKRTSENGFDTHGKVALALKQRIFEVLGFDEYWNGHDDGLQVLRYNLTKAYTPHMDYMTDRSGMELFDYNSAGKGGNRFATVLLYMTDIPEGGGGETVFSKAWPPELPESERLSPREALNVLRSTGDAERAGIKQSSWEEEMVATCRSKLSVRPHSGRAVLFYSQHPNGKQDLMSKHGGCPVLEGDKWAANLWVWNTPRADFPGAPMREDLIAQGVKPPENAGGQQLKATFINTGNDPSMRDAVLYYDEAQFWGKMGHDDPPLRANTFEGHRWNVRVNDQIVKSWVIGPEEKQEFTV